MKRLPVRDQARPLPPVDFLRHNTVSSDRPALRFDCPPSYNMPPLRGSHGFHSLLGTRAEQSSKSRRCLEFTLKSSW